MRIFSFIIIALCGMLTTTASAKDKTKTVSLKVIETSDVHGYFFPYDFVEGRDLDGTLARVNSYVEQQRSNYGDRLLLIDNGDILQGQPTCYWSNFVMTSDENLAASIVNYMRYDAETIGNHDIEPGHRVYDKWIQEVRCPLLGANIVKTTDGKPYVAPYALLKRDGVKIAILGMITPTIPCWLDKGLYDGLEFQEMVSCARRWVNIIKEKEKPDLIFGLFHSGKDGGIVMPDGTEENASERVAREVPGFDVIFFGHDHRVHNLWVTNTEGQQVLLLDPSCFAKNVAEASIELTYTNGKLQKKHIKGNIVNVRNEKVDQRMVEHFKQQTDSIKNYVEREIGTFTAPISTRDCYFGNSAFTDFIQDLQLRITGADISFNAPLLFDATIEQGKVRVADMFKLYRFENRLYVINMKGSEIRKHLEMSYDLWVNTMKSADDHLLLLNEQTKDNQQRTGFKNFSFNFDSATGIDYEVDVTKPDGEKVRILQMTDGKPFDENRWYKVAMNSYRASGGGELLTRGAGIPKDSLDSRVVFKTELDLRHYLMKEIEAIGAVSPQAHHNWKFVPEEWAVPAAKRDRKLLFKD
jgi:2',3'-cyclic-nucleotide 2'-phosphodiesterase/3'-nucleotidase